MIVGDKTALDVLQQLIQIFGIPGLLAGLIWGVRAWTNGQNQLKQIDTNSKSAFETAAIIKLQVDNLQTNHMKHLTEQSEKQVELLTSIDKNLAIQANHTDQYWAELKKMREDFQAHGLDDKYIQAKISDQLDEIKKAVV